MKYIVLTTTNENGNKIFIKRREGKTFLYRVRPDNGYDFDAEKDWLIAHRKSILNLGVSKHSIYPIELPWEKSQPSQNLSNREWVLKFFENMFPNGADTINVEYRKDGCQRWTITDGMKSFVIQENGSSLLFKATDSGNIILNLTVQGSLSSMNFTYEDFVHRNINVPNNMASTNRVQIDTDKVRIARVVFDSKKKEYCYDCNGLNVKENDVVVVPVGDYGHKITGTVVEIETYDSYEESPYYNLKEIESIVEE